MSGEKTEVTVQPATDASVERFHTEPQTDLESFKEAPRYQGGGTHDMEDRGFGSGIGVAQRGENDPDQQQTYTPAEVPSFVQENSHVASLPQEDPDYWKKMYGQSENEKGEIRRAVADEVAQLKAELAAMRATMPQQPGQPYPGATPGYPAQPQYGPQQPQYAQQGQQPQLPETYFPDKEEGDYVEVKDVDRLVAQAIAPAVLQLNAQQQALYQQQMAAMKNAAGITPVVEQKLLAECPWMQQLPDGPAKVQAMQDYMKQRTQQQQPRQPAPQQAQVNPEQAAARRVTYIESGQAAKSTESEVPLGQRIMQEYAQARNAAEKKAVLMKYGMQHVNDWGSDVWGPAR